MLDPVGCGLVVAGRAHAAEPHIDTAPRTWRGAAPGSGIEGAAAPDGGAPCSSGAESLEEGRVRGAGARNHPRAPRTGYRSTTGNSWCPFDRNDGSELSGFSGSASAIPGKRSNSAASAIVASIRASGAPRQ